MTLFDDFWIHIGSPDASQDSASDGAPVGSFRVSVIHSPAGNATSRLSLPFAIAEASDVVARLDQSIRDSDDSRAARDLGRRTAARSSASDLGRDLYRALFTGAHSTPSPDRCLR